MDLNFDFISFLIGLIVGFFVSFILYRLRNQIGRVRQQATERAERARTFATRTTDARYQLDLMTFCQQYHVAGEMVQLSDIVVEPRFVRAIQPYNDSLESKQNVFRVVPMVHEFPTCYASFNIETLGIGDLGAGERHLALLGQQGSGRSTALAVIALWALGQIEFSEAEDLVQRTLEEEEAQLNDEERVIRHKEREEIQARALEQIERAQEQAAEVLKQDEEELVRPPVLDLHQLMPILVHLGDVVVDASHGAKIDPAEPMVRAIQKGMRRVTAMTMPRYIYDRLNSGQALVLIDGFDDLRPEEQQEKLAWLRHFLEVYTECVVIVAGPAVGYHPLLQLGLTPVFVRPWTDLNAQLYVEKWAAAWPQAAGYGKQLADPPDERVVERAALNARGITPLDLTMRVLAAYAADEKQQGRWGWYDAFVARNFSMRAFESNDELFNEAVYALAEVAAATLNSGAIHLERITEIATEAFRETESNGEDGEKEKETFVLDVQEFVDALLKKSGLMMPCGEDTYDFRHPLLKAFLASETLLDAEGEISLVDATADPSWRYAIPFAAAHAEPNVMGQAVVQKLSQQPDLLFSNLFELVYWLPDAPLNAAWRGEIFKRLAAALIAPSQFPVLRERAMAALVTTRDQNILFILRQGLRSTDSTVRRLSCIGLGVLGDTEAIKDLRPMLEDDDLDVQLAAGLALGAIGTERALDMMVDGLISGEETLRQAVAEALAAVPGQGHQLLYTAIQSEDMMVRRAAVFGLARIQTPWALTSMYRALIEDDQWFVRSAAEQAFAQAQDVTHDAVQTHPPLDRLEWLINWAAEKGEGVPTGENASEILIRVLQEGAPPQRLASAHTLGVVGYAPGLKPLYHALNDNNEDVRATAYAALADLQAKIGYPLPGIQ